MDLLQFLLRRPFQALDRPKLSGKDLRRPFTNVTYAETEEQPPKLKRSARIDFPQQVLRGFRAHAFEVSQLLLCEVIEIRNIVNEIRGNELVHKPDAETVNFHGLPAGPM